MDTMAAPLLPRVYEEDGDIGWENHAHDICRKLVSEPVYKELLAEQFKDVPSKPGTGIAGLDVKTKLEEIGLFSRRARISKGSNVSGPPRPVGGAGFATIVNHPKFPDHEFFRPGRHFRVRLRHENLSFEDDAMLDGRVTCVKFCDDSEGGPLDIVLHTGRVAQYHNAASFEEFVTAFSAGEENMKSWTAKFPSHYYGRVENVRRTPGSYYDLRYYSHVAYEFRGTDGLVHLARLRMLPADNSPESGLLDIDDQHHVWCFDRRSGDKQEPDYLRTEYMNRLQMSPLQYRLQIQIREWDEGLKAANPCKPWNPQKIPWLDLAVITIALPLSERLLAKTTLSLTNHQPVFRLPRSQGPRSYFSLAHEMSHLHGRLAVLGKELSKEEKMTKYTITVVTGGMGNAGTDADVLITITGTKGRTKAINLDNPFHDDFEAGQTDVFEIEAAAVGEVVMVQMALRSLLPGRGWFLAYVNVTDVLAEKTARCPCYQWLTSAQPSVLMRTSEALLAHQEKVPYCYLQRKYELDERRKLYRWEKVFGLPSRLKAEQYEDIPREARFHQAKEWDLRYKYLQTLTNTGVGTIKTMFESWDPLKDYIKLVTNVLKDKKTVKMVADRWKDDVEFGRQMLAGPHPVRVKRLTQPPISFPVTDAVVSGLLKRGLKLKEEIKAGHVYTVSYPELTRLVSAINHDPKARSFVADPICMLYVRPSGELVPIAIQLTQHAGIDKLIFTPKDDELEWLVAKMWVRLADAQIHQIEARHLKLHLVMEVFAVATMRNLPTVHPVYKLLVPHLRYTIAGNHLGRQTLCHGDDGLFQKYLSVGTHYSDLIRETYRRFNFASMNLGVDIEDRRVGDEALLPHYYYREDGLALWNIVKKFVRTMVILQYWTDSNVENDEEIQRWMEDVHTNGLPVWEDGTDHNVPRSLRSLSQLIDVVTTLIFTASAQNAALTSPMMDYYGYPPNAPTMLLEPPPFQKGMVSKESLQRALPSRNKSAEIIAACYSLSRFSPDEWTITSDDVDGTLLNDKLYLGEYPDDHFSGDAVLATIDAFREDLKSLSASITARNEKLDVPYTYLQPERIPASVST